MSGFSVGAGYSAEAIAFFNRLATAPTAARAKQYDNFFRSLVSSGAWPLLDALWILAAADEPSAKLNLISANYSLTAVNSPAFVADRGYTGDGSTSYLQGPTLATFGGQYSLNNAHIGIYCGTDTAVSTNSDIGIHSAQIAIKSTSSITRGKMNDSSTGAGAASASSIGHSVSSRDNNLTYKSHKNGAAGTTVTVTTSAITTGSTGVLRICGTNASSPLFSIRQISAAHVGGALTAAQVSAMNLALASYLQSVGAPTA